MRVPSKGFAIFSKDGHFKPHDFSRHAVGPKDVLIDILYAGICHSDIHSAYSEWKEGIYPMVPGHEIAGVIKEVGKEVKKFKVGDVVGVGCFVNSCKACKPCKEHQEQFCTKVVFTYDCLDSFHGNEPHMGGYSNNIVVDENYVISVDKNAPLEKVAPLLCAGITTYSPLKFSKVTKGTKVGVAGFGGLGSMAVKYAVAMGAEVSVFARNEHKKQDALSMGVKHFYTDPKQCKEELDFIISTIPTHYDLKDYLKLLTYSGELALVGLPPVEVAPALNVFEFIHLGNRKVYGSLIGGIKETQEMMDFSIKHNIYPEIDLILGKDIDTAYHNLTHGKAKFRYVIDMKKSFD
ncbi:NAD(P)-dependent alcohol dehydrogenase [Helicobacter pylori]